MELKTAATTGRSPTGEQPGQSPHGWLLISTILAISDDCKRAFSEAGDLLEPRRLKRPDVIAALQGDCSYTRMGFKRSSR